MRAMEIREQLVRLLRKFSIKLVSSDGEVKQIQRCITAGMILCCYNCFHSHTHNQYENTLKHNLGTNFTPERDEAVMY